MTTPSNLTPAEAILAKAIENGREAVFSEATDDKKTIRADALVDIIRRPRTLKKGTEAIRIVGAIITGSVKLRYGVAQSPIEFSRCRFDSRIDLRDAQLKSLRFSECQLVELEATGATINGSIVFEAGTKCSQGVKLLDAQIIGSLEIENSEFQHPPAPVLDGTRMTVEDAMIFRNGTKFHGEVRLIDANIKGSFVCEAVQFRNQGNLAINADRLRIGSSLQIKGGSTAEGEVRMPQATILGSIECEHASFSNENGLALRLSGSNITGAVIFKKETLIRGEAALRFCKMGGTLEAEAATFENPHGVTLSLNRSNIAGGLIFRKGFRSVGEFSASELHTSGILFENAHLDNPHGIALRADGLTTDGSVTFRDDCTSRGAIRMPLSRIGTALELKHTTLSNPTGFTLDAYGFKAGVAVFNDGFVSRGEIRLVGAQIDGNLEIGAVSIENPAFVALRADNLTTKGSVMLQRGSNIRGTLRLTNAIIGSALDCGDAKLINPRGTSIEASEAKIGGSVYLRPGFSSEGRVSFLGARMGGALSCSGASVSAPGWVAFDASAAVIGQSAAFGNGFSSNGELKLMDARIETVLECTESSFRNAGGVCINADRITTKGRVYLQLLGDSNGDVRFVGAKIGTDFELAGGPLEKRGLMTLFGSGLEAGGSLRIAAHCRSIRLTRARIGGDLNCVDTVFYGSDQNSFLGAGMSVKGMFSWRGVSSPDGYVDLTGARVGVLDDDERSWPKPNFLLIDNFVYESLSQYSTWDRRSWLLLQPRFNPQPYEQAGKALRQIGRDKDARKIGIAKLRDQRSRDQLNRATRAWNLFLDLTIGHGYQVWKALLWAAGLVLVGVAVFKLASDLGIMSSDDSKTAAQHPFNSFVYSLDVFLPGVDLYQEKYWRPVPRVWWQGVFLFWAWIEILAGWLLTTVVVAGLTGLVRKE